MNLVVLALLLVAGTSAVSANDDDATTAAREQRPALEFESDRHALAYALGLDRARGLLRRIEYLDELGIELDLRMAERGFSDAVSDASSKAGTLESARLTDERVKTLIYALDREVEAAEQRRARREARGTLERGKQFLSENAARVGVVTLASGLQYRVLESGTGEPVGDHEEAVLQYRGRLIDGTVFASSDEHNADPETFRVSGVIAGWMEALRRMRVGDRWELAIPPHLAYGASAHGRVPPNTVVLFELEVVAVKTTHR